MVLMQGIYLAFQGCEKNILKTLLRGIDFSDYQFEVGVLEAKKEFFLYPHWAYLDTPISITSEQAKIKLLDNDDENEHIENLTLCIRNKSIQKKRIQTFKDLVEGNYDLALKVVDYHRVQIFSPKEDMLKHIMKNALYIDPSYRMIQSCEQIEPSTVIS